MIEFMFDCDNIKLHESRHQFAVRLITSLITGDVKTWKDILKPDEWFITEIVSNKLCNIDVDKFDYILRDESHVDGFVKLKPFIGLMGRAKIVTHVDGYSHIAYHVDDFGLIENLFSNRASLHMEIYQTARVAAAEKMVTDACVKASVGGVTIDGMKLTEVHQNSNAYLMLDDSVLDLIADSKIDNEDVRQAQSIIRSLRGGRIYEMVHEDVSLESNVLEALEKEFGSVFCKVKKFIPSADVPTNIPLYNDAGQTVTQSSRLKLGYESIMTFCTKPDDVLIKSINNFIKSSNNNF